MSFLLCLEQGLFIALSSVTKLALIIIPLMVIIEFAKYYGWLKSLSKQLAWFTGAFYLPGSAALPVCAGLFIGIVSGSGIILQTTKEEHYSRANLTVIFIMVGICHSLFEETALFIGIDVNIAVIAGMRMLIAMLFAYLYALFARKQLVIDRTELNYRW